MFRSFVCVSRLMSFPHGLSHCSPPVCLQTHMAEVNLLAPAGSSRLDQGRTLPDTFLSKRKRKRLLLESRANSGGNLRVGTPPHVSLGPGRPPADHRPRSMNMNSSFLQRDKGQDQTCGAGGWSQLHIPSHNRKSQACALLGRVLHRKYDTDLMESTALESASAGIKYILLPGQSD